MLWSPKLSLSNIHVRLTAKGLLRNIQLLSGCRKNTVVFQHFVSFFVIKWYHFFILSSKLLLYH
uniref:Uncharacterized protein n=1 Tax=Oreochromis aureus TaxID=47969 RepID=A0A668V646_OREAU